MPTRFTNSQSCVLLVIVIVTCVTWRLPTAGAQSSRALPALVPDAGPPVPAAAAASSEVVAPPLGSGTDATASAAPVPAASVEPASVAADAQALSAQASDANVSAPEAVTTTKPSQLEVDRRDGMLALAGYPLTPSVTSADYPDEFVILGYAQGQYEAHQDSEDQQQQGGTLLNKDRFVLRRGRVRVVRDWQWGQVQLEIDGNSVRGPTARLQKAEVSLLYGRQSDKDQPPLIQLTFGQFDVPFGFETTYSPKARWFMERTAGSRALFPGEPDVGARISGAIAFARYSIAITNGEPLDERSGFGLQDPNRDKDVTARFGAEAKLTRKAVLAGGISFNRGRGLHAATDATKNGLSWRDLNENGNVDQGEVFGQPSAQAVPAKTFARWAFGADLEFMLRTRLGWSMLYGEAFAASNLDRGLVVADPIATGSNIREFGYYVAFTQEITRYGVVGLRYDYYDPNSDFLDSRAGKLIPTSQRVRTVAPLIALTFPNRARLVFEWDFVRDYLARDARGVPKDLRNNQWTLRLQGMF
jgi:phosphate-selective porin